MDKENTSGERKGHEELPETDRTGMNEAERRQLAEQAREQHGEQARPGGEASGRTSEGTKSGRARALKRSHHAGRVRDEFGGAFGKTK